MHVPLDKPQVLHKTVSFFCHDNCKRCSTTQLNGRKQHPVHRQGFLGLIKLRNIGTKLIVTTNTLAAERACRWHRRQIWDRRRARGEGKAGLILHWLIHAMAQGILICSAKRWPMTSISRKKDEISMLCFCMRSTKILKKGTTNRDRRLRSYVKSMEVHRNTRFFP